jgi:hypothetical protein
LQEPPEELRKENIKVIWNWAIENWDINKLKMLSTLDHIDLDQ